MPDHAEAPQAGIATRVLVDRVVAALGAPRTAVRARLVALVAAGLAPRIQVSPGRFLHGHASACRLALASACAERPCDAAEVVAVAWAMRGSRAGAGAITFGTRLETVFAKLVADPDMPVNGTGARADPAVATMAPFLDVSLASSSVDGVRAVRAGRLAYGVAGKTRIVQEYRRAEGEAPAAGTEATRRLDTVALTAWRVLAEEFRTERP